MAIVLEVARTGLTALILHPLRSLTTAGFLVAVLFPFLAGLGLSQGLQDQAELSMRVGADLYVTARQFGRPVPIPTAVADEIRALPGVLEVTPRIVGAMVLGADNENAIVVGMPTDRFPTEVRCVEGNLPRDSQRNELVVGADLARRLRLKVGTVLPPFYRNADGERLSQVVGVFRSDAGLWQARIIFASFDTAAHIFDQKAMATDLLVTCRPGYARQVTAALLARPWATEKGSRPWRIHVAAREDVAALVRSGLRHREGIFSLHFLLAFVVGILGILVTSGVGLTERRREIGILKATGWQTDEVLLRSAVENLLLTIAGASIAVVLAFAWLKWFNGYWIASVFLTGVETAPSFPVPFRLTPVPVLLAFLIGLVIVLSGTLYSSWRAATVAPMTALR